jgi:2-C-methyl-D-erythritol 4-phosphate cytidylyltransferase
MLTVSLVAADASASIDAIVIAAPEGFEAEAEACAEGLSTPVQVVTGGVTRQASVRAAVAVLVEAEIVVVHDAARPFASPELFDDVVQAVREGVDGAIPVIPVSDTVKRLDGVRVVDTVSRDDLGLAQTPQAFRLTSLRRAHEHAVHAGLEVTDDAMLLEQVGTVVAVPGDPRNFKVTTLLDLARAEERMGGRGG